MDRDRQRSTHDGSDASPPSEAWLFAQAILGRPIPQIISPDAKAQVKREELERTAQFSASHADELRRRQASELSSPLKYSCSGVVDGCGIVFAVGGGSRQGGFSHGDGQAAAEAGGVVCHERRAGTFAGTSI